MRRLPTCVLARKINLVVESRVKTLCGEIRERRAGFDINRIAGIVAPTEERINSGRAMRVARLKLHGVSLIVIVGADESRCVERICGFAEKHAGYRALRCTF